ncbi:MAG: hypothetical protein KF911_11130 [Pseudomonadales bacterium]|nr:hypothetical protein [Pseudomonadales bacterium]
MNKQPDQNDDDLRALLGADTAEPPDTLDARILAAARAARQMRPAAPGITDTHTHGAETGSHRRGRPWYLPAGLGAAAAVLLAVLVVDRAPEVSIGPGASPPPPQLTRPEAPAALAQDAQAERFALARERAMPDEAAADSALVAADPAPAARSAPAPRGPAAEAPAPRGPAAEAPAPTCPASATPQSGEGLLLCLTPLHVEIHDRSTSGCTQPLVLARSAGNVSLARDGPEVIIRVDGIEQWRVQCTAGAWAVRAARP